MISLQSRHLSRTDNGNLRVQAGNSEVLPEDSQTDYFLLKQPPWVLKAKIHEQMEKFLRPLILLRYPRFQKNSHLCINSLKKCAYDIYEEMSNKPNTRT